MHTQSSNILVHWVTILTYAIILGLLCTMAFGN
jgi:hypothetical protein